MPSVDATRRRMLASAAAFAAAASLPTLVSSLAAADPKTKPEDLAGPWQSPDAAIVLDPYHSNNYAVADLKLDPRIVAVVHKTSEGASFVDKKYVSRKAEAIAAGYLWGSYHLGRPGDPAGQAERYVNLARPAPNEVIALDLETDGGAMSMAEAATFIRRLHELTGRYPLLYGGRYTVSRPVNADDRDTFRQCRLWIVDTRNTPNGWPLDLWPKYTLWQFSSELRYRYPIKAADPKHPVSWDIDVNYIAGTREQVRHEWPL